MKHAPSSLATAVDGMTGELRLHADAQTGALAVLFALIDACLLRILTRLADMIALWQAGQLPIPTPRKQTTRATINLPPNPRPDSASPRHSTRPRHQTPSTAHPTPPTPSLRAAAKQSRLPSVQPHPTDPRQTRPPPPRPPLRHRAAFPLDPRSITPLGPIATACPYYYDIKT